MTPDEDVLAPLIAEAEVLLTAKLAARPALAAAADTTKRADEDAQNRLDNFQLRVNRATRRGIDLLAPVVARLLEDERRRRHVAAAAATRARKLLENVDWEISCARADLDQLALLRKPPSAADYRPDVEIIKRPAPAWAENFDPIEFPRATPE